MQSKKRKIIEPKEPDDPPSKERRTAKSPQRKNARCHINGCNKPSKRCDYGMCRAHCQRLHEWASLGPCAGHTATKPGRNRASSPTSSPNGSTTIVPASALPPPLPSPLASSSSSTASAPSSSSSSGSALPPPLPSPLASSSSSSSPSRHWTSIAAMVAARHRAIGDGTERPTRVRVKAKRGIVFGHKAWKLDKETDEQHTHGWTAFVKGPPGDRDISYFVKKVVFQLDPSFKKPHKRVVNKPPFKITATAYESFDLGIWLHFVDKAEAPVSLGYYRVQLDAHGTQMEYNEIIFESPTMHSILQGKRNGTARPSISSSSYSSSSAGSSSSSSSTTTTTTTHAGTFYCVHCEGPILQKPSFPHPRYCPHCGKAAPLPRQKVDKLK